MKLLLALLLLAGFLLWWPTAGSPHVLRWAAVGLLGGTLLYGVLMKGFRWDLPRFASLLLVSWLAISLAWSLDVAQGSLALLQLCSLWLVFVGASILRPVFAPTIMLGIALALVMVFVFPLPVGGFGNANWVANWLLMALPLAGFWAWENRHTVPLTSTGGLCVLATAWIMFMSSSDSWFAVAIVCALAFLISKKMFWTATMAIVVPLNFIVWLNLWPESIFIALQRRAEIWINTTAAWWDAPLLGHGLGSYNFIYDKFRETHVDWMPGYDTQFHPITTIVGWSHNEPLQLLAEGGIVALALAGFFVWTVLRNSSGERSCRWTLLVAGTLTLISSPLQNPETALVVAVALGLVAGSQREPVRSSSFSSSGSMFSQFPLRGFWARHIVSSTKSQHLGSQ